jgi:hypothetical protein
MFVLLLAQRRRKLGNGRYSTVLRKYSCGRIDLRYLTRGSLRPSRSFLQCKSDKIQAASHSFTYQKHPSTSPAVSPKFRNLTLMRLRGQSGSFNIFHFETSLAPELSVAPVSPPTFKVSDDHSSVKWDMIQISSHNARQVRINTMDSVQDLNALCLL